MKVLICDHPDSMMPDHALEIETLRAGLGADVEVEVYEYDEADRDGFYARLADADALLTEVEQRAGQDLAIKLRNSIADAEEHRRDVEALTEDNERLQTLLEQATATAMEMQDRYRAVLNLIAKHFCAKGEHLPGEPDDHGIVYCAACDEILNADDPDESPCCGGEDCGNDSCESCGACAPAEENRE